MISRREVFAAINSEREYQDRRWGGREHDEQHEPATFIVFMENYLNEAKSALSNEKYMCYAKAMDSMRKVAALAVACMEVYGVENRC